MYNYRRLFCAALLLVGGPALVNAQTPADTLPCDSWLTTIANGVTSLPDFQLLYRIDGCERPDSAIVAARETGTRALIARNEIGAAAVYLSYLELDAAWFTYSYLSFVLPLIADKSKSEILRGKLMALLATNLQPHDSPVGNVFVVLPGQTPGTSARCTIGMVIHDRPEKTFLPASLVTIKNAAQAMVDDGTEVPQLREAAKCLVKAADFAIAN